MSHKTSKIKLLSYLTGFIYTLISHSLFAIDYVRYESGQSDMDSRLHYKHEVIISALEHTIDTYGPYHFSTDAPRMNATRALIQVAEGSMVNVFIALTNDDWESQTIPIRIPIRRGILNYRLLLIHKDDLPLFKSVKSTEDLMALHAGVRNSWTLAKVLDNLGYKIILGSSYDGLFSMLERQRFHYIPRGINEIYDELDIRKGYLDNLVVEPDLALYIPSATYIFVSPKYPRLARRLEEGLERMVKNGTLEAIFDQHFGKYIQKADLNNRRIINVGNPLLPELTPLHRHELWWSPQ